MSSFRASHTTAQFQIQTLVVFKVLMTLQMQMVSVTSGHGTNIWILQTIYTVLVEYFTYPTTFIQQPIQETQCLWKIAESCIRNHTRATDHMNNLTSFRYVKLTDLSVCLPKALQHKKHELYAHKQVILYYSAIWMAEVKQWLASLDLMLHMITVTHSKGSPILSSDVLTLKYVLR